MWNANHRTPIQTPKYTVRVTLQSNVVQISFTFVYTYRNQTDSRKRDSRTSGKEITKKESLHVDMFASEAMTNSFSKPLVVVLRECCARHVLHVGAIVQTPVEL